MLPRILEPEVMDTVEEAVDYDAMDHSTVNRVFVDDFLAAGEFDGGAATAASGTVRVLDTGTGTAQIPIELCSRSPGFHVTAIDLASEMLKVAESNVAAAGFAERIDLRLVDSKQLPWADGTFDCVMSNSIVHHIPRPKSVFAEMHRVLAPGGLLFVRDLLRPPDEETLEALVREYAGDENDHQRQMFRDSLHAALTIAEVQAILAEIGIAPDAVAQTTDRHWTLRAVRETDRQA